MIIPLIYDYTTIIYKLIYNSGILCLPKKVTSIEVVSLQVFIEWIQEKVMNLEIGYHEIIYLNLL